MNSPKITNIYGPPGTGKTTTCINTVLEWLKEGVLPERIGYYAFTKVAAHEALSRALDQTGYSAHDFPWFRNLHSAAYRLASVANGSVADKDKVAGLCKSLRVPYNPYVGDLESLQEGYVPEGNLMIAVWDFGRNRLETNPEVAWQIAPPSFTLRIDKARYLFFVRKLEEWKKQKGFVDFTDMLSEALRSNDTTGCTHVVVDEAQDLSPLQWNLARMLESEAKEVVRAGDDDQAIYGFTGARAEDYVNIEGDQRVLSQSYRVPRLVHERAQEIIAGNKKRVEKEYLPRDAQGSLKRANITFRDDLPTEGTIGVLFRNRKHLKTLADSLIEYGVPFGSNRYNTPLSNAVLIAGIRAGLKWQERGSLPIREAVAILEMISKTPYAGEYIQYGARQRLEREADKRPMQQISEFGLTPEGKKIAETDVFLLAEGANKSRAGHLDYLRKISRKHGMKVLTDEPRVTLTTVHGAKGAEFDHVYLSQDATGNCQDFASEDPDEERRIKYVALTRAKQTATLLPERAEGGWSL